MNFSLFKNISFWVLAFKNLSRNLKRNLATGSAIALGFTGILFLGGYAFRLDNYLRVYTVYTLHTGHLTIYAKSGLEKFNLNPKKMSLNLTQQNKIEEVLKNNPNIEIYEKQLSGMGLVGNGCFSFPFVAHGIDPLVDQKLKSHSEVQSWMPDMNFFIKGRGLWNFDGAINPVAVSQGLANALGKLKVHDEITDLNSKIPDCKDPKVRDFFLQDANIQLMAGTWRGSVGILDAELVSHYTTGFEEGDNSALQIRLDQLQKIYDTDKVERFSVWLKDPSQIEQVKKTLLTQLRDSEIEIHKWNNEDLSPYYYGTTEFIDYLVSFIGIVLLVVIIFSVLNSVTMTVLERSQEMGMYRSVGFRKAHVNQLFLIESFWLTVISLLLGGVFCTVVIAIVHALEIMYYPPGIIGGVQIKVYITSYLIFYTASSIVFMNLLVTYAAVKFRLKISVANLVGGLFR